MSANNGYASLVKQRADGTVKRRKLDDYETPPSDTRKLINHGPKFKGPILEPACGSGRMKLALGEATGLRVYGGDIKFGEDFLKRTKTWPGDIITNPPYRDGLAEKFVRHALKTADGRVAMLMQSGFIWGGKRGEGLFADTPPDRIIVMPNRIYFYAGGKPITSQFFSHAWLVWPDRATRTRGGYGCVTVWAKPEDDCGF